MAARRNKNGATDEGRPVRFYLNGEMHEASGIQPVATVLNYLRDTLLKTGTKEGCAEGDCGACTVVIAENQQGRIRFRSINSCIQFLPTLDGKALFTVEGLAQGSRGRLHPVQQAMVDCHGSQCGFCTPGFIMSLFALYKSQVHPSREDIDDALAGNLCRCTGYRPIIDAATRMYEYGGELAGDEHEFLAAPFREDQADKPGADEQVLLDRLDAIRPSRCLSINGRYFAPPAIDELAALVKQHPDAIILAGGTDVGLWVTKQYRELPVVIYLGQVSELKTITADEDAISIGAAVSLADAFSYMLSHYPDLHEIVRRFASPPIRNAGTLCGNIANGSPIGDSMPALISLGAQVLLRCGDSQRSVSLDEFYLGYQQKDLQKGEFVEAVRIPLPQTGQHFRSYKISKRFDQDISAVCGAFALRLKDGRVEDVRICYGGMAAVPARARQCEAALARQAWQEETIGHAMDALARDFTPLTDMRASADYRLRVAANLLKRFFHEVDGADVALTHVLRYGS